jgi:putative PIN family toxin of toxin-antitoxin system
MRAVLDTNVLISAVITTGPPYHIYNAWLEGAFELVISPALIKELEIVLARPHIIDRIHETSFSRSAFIGDIRERAVVVTPREEVTRISADPPDNRVLEAAVEGAVDYIVTGDRHLIDLERHESTDIVTPARFLAILTTESTNL